MFVLRRVELDSPILSEAIRLANFTDELGVDGIIWYLRNVGGHWQQCKWIRGSRGRRSAPVQSRSPARSSRGPSASGE